MNSPISTVVGADDAWQAVVRDATGAPVAFAGTETLAGRVWPGEGRPTLFAPGVSFVTPGAGLIRIEVAAVQTAALEPALYRMQVTVTSAGQTAVCWDGSLRLTAAPGTEAAPVSYASYSDVRALAPWVDRLQDPDTDAEGFADQRAEARRWFDTLLLKHFRGAGYSSLGPNGYQMNNLGGPWRSGLTSDYLRDLLAGGALMVRDEVVRCVASMAVSLICQRQVGQKGGGDYWRLAAWYRHQAEEMAKTLSAEVDSDGDGRPNFTISIGATDTLLG